MKPLPEIVLECGYFLNLMHLGFYGTINCRIRPKKKSTVPSIPFLDFRGASIAALGKVEIFVWFHHKTLLDSSRAFAAQKNENQEKDAQPEKITRKIVFPTSEIPRKILRRCLARSKTVGHTGKTKNKKATTAAKLNVARPKTPSKVRAVGARRLVRVKKKQKQNKERDTADTKPKTKTAQKTISQEPGLTKRRRPRTTGKQWYDQQVCYDPMHPTLPPLHMHRCGNQVCCEGGRQRDYATHKNEQRNNRTCHESCIHTIATPIYPYVHRRQAPARYMKTETRSRRDMVWQTTQQKRYWKPYKHQGKKRRKKRGGEV